ncbi:MAG: hypothetical protein COU90_01970 [Candidatus Ryanbacteria bacterium CG10_big_fil_rev_8_21_14_0_10_43_42]|uniref:DUF218 domain-containing protein n=1 Tax=Candidatus Ryanbacteria bacterium CG10_big_fil_rev_8_21_14_0_10_43_42 TaxID=1974864 RepID=A0A2M8KXC2_9BACT|nr:MAG: hypothetical protein COU90_01970 [Candidatus Ryanbacteria bacterium CG10_big_fil_rev_8_21_14_0_10_43_42]
MDQPDQGHGKIAAYCMALLTQPLEKADAIAVFTGDGRTRVTHAHEIYQRGLAPLLMITGADDLLSANPQANAEDYAHYLIEQKSMSRDRIVTDATDVNPDFGKTCLGQAASIVYESRKRGWQTIILVASHYHIPRAYMTLLKICLKETFDLRIIAAPSRLPWFSGTEIKVHPVEPWLRFWDEEWPRITTYQDKGDVATWGELGEYLLRQNL